MDRSIRSQEQEQDLLSPVCHTPTLGADLTCAHWGWVYKDTL